MSQKTCDVCGRSKDLSRINFYGGSKDLHATGSMYLCKNCMKTCKKCDGVIETKEIRECLELWREEENWEEIGSIDFCECGYNPKKEFINNIRSFIRFLAYTTLFCSIGGTICRYFVDRGEAQYCFFIVLLITIPYIWFYLKDCEDITKNKELINKTKNEMKEAIDYYKCSKIVNKEIFVNTLEGICGIIDTKE